MVWVGLLGPLLVVGEAGWRWRVAAPKERAVLAVLALRAGRSVPAGELIDRLVGGGSAHVGDQGGADVCVVAAAVTAVGAIETR